MKLDPEQSPQQQQVSWMKEIVTHPPQSTKVTDVIDSFGGSFRYCTSHQIKDQLYFAANSTFAKTSPKLFIPFIYGGPGTGKTRMLLETLNMLKDCAKKQENALLDSQLLSDETILLYVTYGNGSRPTNNEVNDLFKLIDISGSVVARILLNYYNTGHESLQDFNFEHWQNMTLCTLMDRFAELGVKNVVLAIDEINSLYDYCKDGFRKLVTSISRAVHAHNKRLLVLFAGTIHTPLREVISTIGFPLSVFPCLLSLGDVTSILDAMVKDYPYLLNWSGSKQFQKCLADLVNPPRLLEQFLALVNQHAKVLNKSLPNLDCLPFNAIKQHLLSSYQIGTPGADTARALVEMCLSKAIVSFTEKLPNGETIEDGARNGYLLFGKANHMGVHIAIPPAYLLSWLQFDDYFVYAHKLFTFSWDDKGANTLDSWATFNVKYIAFKLGALSAGNPTPMNLKDFHSGAEFGSKCHSYFVDKRVVEPVLLLEQFPNSFKGDEESPVVTSLLDGRSFKAPLKSLVCQNDTNTTGVDAFYWLSNNVIEFQQYTSNDSTKDLTQEELDYEYEKAEKLFNTHLAHLGYDWVFGMISNRHPHTDLKLKPNMYVVHKNNMEEYFGPTFASLAQIKCKFCYLPKVKEVLTYSRKQKTNLRTKTVENK